MKVIDYQTEVVRGNVWPEHGPGPHGPHIVRFGVRMQPPIIKGWVKGRPVSFSIEQPNEEDNFTMIRLLFLKGGTSIPSAAKGIKFKNLSQFRNKGGGMRVRIKVRYTNSLPHPVPTGTYIGSMFYDLDNTFAFLTLQAGTLRKEPEPSKPKVIITPGDIGFNESIAAAKRIVH